MYYLMSALLAEMAQAISISWLEAGIGIVTIIITIMGTAWKINRASRQDIESKLVKKVDVVVFEKTCDATEKEILHLDEKINETRKSSQSSYEILDKKLDKIDNNVNKLIDFHLNEKK